GDARSNRTWNVCCRQDAGGTRNNSPIYVGDRIRLTHAVTVEGRHQLSSRRRQAISDRVECQTRKTAFPSRNPLALTGNTHAFATVVAAPVLRPQRPFCYDYKHFVALVVATVAYTSTMRSAMTDQENWAACRVAASP